MHGKTMAEENQNDNDILYNRYKQCRDQEIDRFWKNSVFVWTFLGMCFGAYSALFIAKDVPCCSQTYIPYIMLYICSLGFAVSFIWLWMARASKAWYEVFETAIWKMESCDQIITKSNDYLIHNFWSVKREKGGKGYKNIFNSRPLSPSKIVIGIGWNLIILWLMIGIFTIVRYSNGLKGWAYLALVPIISIIYMRFCGIRSSTLRNLNEEDVYKALKKDFKDLYFEVKFWNVLFYIPENNAIQSFKSIIDKFKGIKYTIDGLKLSYSYFSIKKHYKLRQQKVDDFIKLIKSKDIIALGDITGTTIYIDKNKNEALTMIQKILSEKYVIENDIINQLNVEQGKIYIPIDFIGQKK